MKNYVTTLYRNTALPASARIGTCYCYPIPNDSRKLFVKMYLRLGLTVVVIRHSREDTQHCMLRRILIALSLYPTFILRCQKWCDLNPSIPLDLQNQISFLERYELPKLMKLPISALMESALSAMAIFGQLPAWPYLLRLFPRFSNAIRKSPSSIHQLLSAAFTAPEL